ncbi:hypothetical protein GCM10022215_15920 [Nocardioides fonticola]|uniref:DUF4439 domain-containing protein n=1 Tax=Nocardioides fonticola TaxID=450363 RepID=A0ABP7XH34_9ACTN
MLVPRSASPSSRSGALLLPVAVALLVATGAVGCSGEQADPVGARPASRSEPTDRGTTPAADPSLSPSVVAAAAVGERSHERVATLHALGAATLRDTGLPGDALAAQGRTLAADLEALAADASRLPPPAGSPAERLVDALGDYRALATELGRRSPAALPGSWFARIARVDRSWRGSLRDLAELSGRREVADVPDLLLPAGASAPTR